MTAAAERQQATPEDPRNAILDLVEAVINTCKAHDIEAPLRARLARLLPSPKPEAPGADLDALEMSRLANVLKAYGKRSMKPAEMKGLEAAQAYVDQLMGLKR